MVKTGRKNNEESYEAWTEDERGQFDSLVEKRMVKEKAESG